MDAKKEVKVLAIVILAGYGWVFLGSVIQILSILSGDLTATFYKETAELVGFSYKFIVISTIIKLVASAFLVIGSIGMLKRKELGRKTVIYTLIAYIIASVIVLVYSITTKMITGLQEMYTLAMSFFYLIIFLSIIFFLTRKSVKEILS